MENSSFRNKRIPAPHHVFVATTIHQESERESHEENEEKTNYAVCNQGRRFVLQEIALLVHNPANGLLIVICETVKQHF